MQEASFIGLIRALIYFFAFYYIVKFLARLFLPVLAKKVVEKAEEQFKQQHQQYQDQSTSYQSQTPKNDVPHETKKVGEYIDFEEVE
jgi:hypothetical protein